jgi:hypothetical protein
MLGGLGRPREARPLFQSQFRAKEGLDEVDGPFRTPRG